MKKLTKIEQKKISDWLYATGRELDIARYNLIFDDGGRSSVLHALTLYINDDGGFGKGLEPDIHAPHSNVPCTLQALYYLLEANFYFEENSDDLFCELVEGALNFLFDGVTWFDDQLPLTVKENNKYPCAMWFKHTDERHSIASIHPTIEVVAFALNFLSKEHKYYVRAKNMLDFVINNILAVEKMNVYALRATTLLYRVIADKMPTHYAIRMLAKKIFMNLDMLEEYDIESLYVVLRDVIGLEFGDTRMVDDYLDYLIDTRMEAGLWDVTWTWGNKETYFDIAKLLWVSDLAVSNLNILDKYGRLEGR